MSRVRMIFGFIVLASSVLCLAGCGGGGSAASSPSANLGSRAAASTQSGPFSLTLTTAQSAYTAGQPAAMTLTVTNTSSAPATLTSFAFGYDFEVVSGGTPVYQFTAGKALPNDIVVKTLAPGAQVSYPLVWNQQDNGGATVKPGSYTIAAWTTNGGVDQLGATDTMAAPALTITVE